MAGKRLTMSFANNRTGELWAGFMPHISGITNRASSLLYSLQIYDPLYFVHFNPARNFDKLALVEVTEKGPLPAGFEFFELHGGLYAVFHYKGLSSDSSIFSYIYTTWLPASGYVLDNRPHFEVLGDKYKNNDPASEEDIWIPIVKKV